MPIIKFAVCFRLFSVLDDDFLHAIVLGVRNQLAARRLAKQLEILKHRLITGKYFQRTALSDL